MCHMTNLFKVRLGEPGNNTLKNVTCSLTGVNAWLWWREILIGLLDYRCQFTHTEKQDYQNPSMLEGCVTDPEEILVLTSGHPKM